MTVMCNLCLHKCEQFFTYVFWCRSFTLTLTKKFTSIYLDSVRFTELKSAVCVPASTLTFLSRQIFPVFWLIHKRLCWLICWKSTFSLYVYLKWVWHETLLAATPLLWRAVLFTQGMWMTWLLHGCQIKCMCGVKDFSKREKKQNMLKQEQHEHSFWCSVTKSTYVCFYMSYFSRMMQNFQRTWRILLHWMSWTTLQGVIQL